MGILGWHSGSVFFVAGYMYKKKSGFIFMVRFLILKAKCIATSGIKCLLKHRRRYSEGLEKSNFNILVEVFISDIYSLDIFKK